MLRLHYVSHFAAGGAIIEELQNTLRKRLLKAMKIDDTRGQRLVPLREMLQNLQS